MIGQARRHRRGARPPHLRCTTALGDFGSRQRLAQTGVGQDNIVLDLEQGQLIPQARFARAERVAPTPNRRHALPDVEVEPLHKGGSDRPAVSRQHLLKASREPNTTRCFTPTMRPRRYDLSLSRFLSGMMRL